MAQREEKLSSKEKSQTYRYGISKGIISDTSINKAFLLRLNNHHKRLLLSAHAWAYKNLHKFGQSPFTAQLCDKMLGYFDHWHIKAIKTGLPEGNGGYLWLQLVTDCLKELGGAAIE